MAKTPTRLNGAYTHTPVVERVEIYPGRDVYLNRREDLRDYRIYIPVLEHLDSLDMMHPETVLFVRPPKRTVKVYELREHVTRIWRCERVEIVDPDIPKIAELGFYEYYHAYVFCDPNSEKTMQEMQEMQDEQQ